MSGTDRAIGLAIARLAVVGAMAVGIYTITGRLMALSTTTAGSLSTIAGTSPAMVTPRLPSDAEMNRLGALTTQIDVLSNNLANAQTQGFKRQRLNTVPAADGTVSVRTELDLTQGRLESTGLNTDLAIEGEGFFKIKISPNVGDGTAYTRNGALFTNKNGDLVVGLGDGCNLIPNINIPMGATQVSIAQDGTVNYVAKGSVRSASAGQILLCQFANPRGLRSQGGCLFLESFESGAPIVTCPGDNGSGQLIQGCIEQSNVDSMKEQVALLRAEQLLDQGTQPIRAAASAIQLVASIKR